MKQKNVWAFIALLSVAPSVAVTPKRMAAAVGANATFV